MPCMPVIRKEPFDAACDLPLVGDVSRSLAQAEGLAAPLNGKLRRTQPVTPLIASGIANGAVANNQYHHEACLPIHQGISVILHIVYNSLQKCSAQSEQVHDHERTAFLKTPYKLQSVKAC